MTQTHKRVRRQQRKAELVKLKGGRCENCLQIFPDECFDFHHVRMSDKAFSLSQATLGSKRWDTLLAEANKCALLCACCHRTVHSMKDPRWLHERIDSRH